MQGHKSELRPELPPEPAGIVSVNSRGGTSNGMTGKLAFVLLIAGLVIIGALIAFNGYRKVKKAEEAESKIAAGSGGKPADPGKRRVFSTDPPPLPGATVAKEDMAAASASPVHCPDNTIGQPLRGPDGKPMTSPSGQAIRVCRNGQVVVPAVLSMPGEPGQPIPVISNSPSRSSAAPAPVSPVSPVSRYDGDVMLPENGNASVAPTLDPSNPYIQALLRSSSVPGGATGAAQESTPAHLGQAGRADSNVEDSLGSLLKGNKTKAVAARMIGNRDMILPEGRSIDCNLSVRIINEVSGKATCVLSSNVYSDNGRVVLAERGSTAVGEYVALTAQGQRRLFVLWTRLQTPNGVVIDVNSPATDSLGTSGLPGEVDNRWPERIGAAVLLSLVEDAIAYETAKASGENGNSGASGIALLQSTTQTGHSLAERILASTINIKPTIYKHQGDRASIFVSRDLDFGSVYALRAK
jgi:type IV secretion system protein VirB10